MKRVAKCQRQEGEFFPTCIWFLFECNRRIDIPNPDTKAGISIAKATGATDDSPALVEAFGKWVSTKRRSPVKGTLLPSPPLPGLVFVSLELFIAGLAFLPTKGDSRPGVIFK